MDPAAGDRADSAGVPWAGRTLPQGGFDGDDGTADPVLSQAIAAAAAGSADEVDVVAALATARLMVPVVAVLGEGGEAAHGPADKSADMALVTLTGPDGRRALPVFTGLESLHRWDTTARPVPVEARRAAVSAVAEGCDLLVVDPAGPVTFVVSRPAVWALGQGRAWVPAHRDAEVLAALAEAGDGVAGVLAVDAEPGDQSELRVVVRLDAGLGQDAVRAAAAAVAQRIQASDVVRERVDGVQLAVAAPT
jgi:hypothetical protein